MNDMNLYLAQKMLEMIHSTFGHKWKLAMADGAFTNGLMKILASLQQEPITGSLKQYGEDNVRHVLLWAKIYALASSEYAKVYNDLIENKQLSDQIMEAKQAREDASKKAILEIVSYLTNTEGAGGNAKDLSVIASLFGGNDGASSVSMSTVANDGNPAVNAPPDQTVLDVFNTYAGADNKLGITEFNNFFDDVTQRE